MGIFGGNGFQGPGEEFGNSWDSFQTGQGNSMTGPNGTSNGQGVWSNTGTTSPFGQSNGLVGPERLQSIIKSSQNPGGFMGLGNPFQRVEGKQRFGILDILRGIMERKNG